MSIKRHKPMFSHASHEFIEEMVEKIKRKCGDDPKLIGPMLCDIGVYLGNDAGLFQEAVMHGSHTLLMHQCDQTLY